MKNNFEDLKHTRRAFLKEGTRALAGLSLASVAPHSVMAESSTLSRRPNFVIFLGEGVRADEFSSRKTEAWDADGRSIGCNKIISTPHLDRIMREGATFNNAFVVNAICLPSRATVLTGLYSHTTGCIDNGRNRKIPNNVPTIADILRDNGYEVAFFGKAHVHDLSKRNWDTFFGIEAAGTNPYHPVIIESRHGIVSPPRKYHGYCDDLWTSRALDWLNQKHEKPFCLFLWFVMPHEPFYRARRYADLYNGVKIPKPNTFDNDLKGYPGKPVLRRPLIAARLVTTVDSSCPRTLEEVAKDHMAGVVDNDDNARRIMDALEKMGILDETAIILSADHGFFLGEWCLYNKEFMYEPAIRVPLAVRYPRLIKPGAMPEQMALNLDIAPTVLEIAGLKVPEWMQGRSLIPLTKDTPVPSWRKDWLYEYYDPVAPKSRGVRTEQYKLIHYWEAPEEFELYDLRADPGELHNLYRNPQYGGIAARLLERIRHLRVETGDVFEG